MVNPHVVYHVASMGNWKQVVAEQLDLLAEVGLTDDIRISYLGTEKQWLEEQLREHGLSYEIVRESDSLHHYETLAMLTVEELAKVEQTNKPILYFHTKGVSVPGSSHKRAWRLVMQHHVLRKWKENLTYIDEGFDAVGVNWHSGKKKHFSGTFWIASPNWIRRLPAFGDYHTGYKFERYSCEMWIGSIPGCKPKSLCCTNEPFWESNYNFSRLLPGLNQVFSSFDYRGLTAQQHFGVKEVFRNLLASYKPHRILEIGVGKGGFTKLLRDTIKSIPILGVDIVDNKVYNTVLQPMGVDVRVGHIFDADYTTLHPDIKQFIQQPGKTLILCDGSQQPREFYILSKHAKEGDAILAHDYAPNEVVFQEKYVNKIWNWMEFQDSDAEPAVKEFSMTRFEEESLSQVAWCGYIRGKTEDNTSFLPISVVIPTIPTRSQQLMRALASVEAQNMRPAEVIVETDKQRLGAPGNRFNGVKRATQEWVAFLDDDDTFYPDHLEKLYECAQGTNADMVYSYFDLRDANGKLINEQDPIKNIGIQCTKENPQSTTIVMLIKRELILSTGFRPITVGTIASHEDDRLRDDLLARGCKIVHLPVRTWNWYHWGYGEPGVLGNTSGMPNRW